MANLLPRKGAPEPFPILDPEQASRFVRRFVRVVGILASPMRARLFEAPPERLESALDELETACAPITASGLLDAIEGILERLEIALPASGDPSTIGAGDRPLRASEAGTFVCYRPGRSLSTGESEVASRGFFDRMDRPPIGLWLEMLARPTSKPRARFDIAIVAWVPAEDRVRAERGCAANERHSLGLLEEVAPEVDVQLREIVDGLRVG